MRTGLAFFAVMLLSATAASATTHIDFRDAGNAPGNATFSTQGSDLFVTGPGFLQIWDTPRAIGAAAIEIGFGPRDTITITQAGELSLLHFGAGFARDWFASGLSMPLSYDHLHFAATGSSDAPADARFRPTGDLMIDIGGRAIRITGLRAGSTPWTISNFDLGTRIVSATGAVPEPASWALMIAGFALVGAALRRRTLRAV